MLDERFSHSKHYFYELYLGKSMEVLPIQKLFDLIILCENKNIMIRDLLSNGEISNKYKKSNRLKLSQIVNIADWKFSKTINKCINNSVKLSKPLNDYRYARDNKGIHKQNICFFFAFVVLFKHMCEFHILCVCKSDTPKTVAKLREK